MVVHVSEQNIGFFEALASPVRIEVLRLLSMEELNIKELAARVGVSASIMTKHIKKLESAGLILTRLVSREGSSNKLCTLLNTEYRLELPYVEHGIRDMYEISMPVGHYTDICAQPTCGLADEREPLGSYDDPRVFFLPQRVNAQLLWLTQGYVEYKFPNYITSSQIPEEIEISMEIGSEAPGYNNNWPSDISFSLNDIPLFTWTSPGDFGERRGLLTPSWWTPNQYGLLKTVRINTDGIFLDDVLKSKTTLSEIPMDLPAWRLRLEVPSTARHIGGLTLFGRGFGDHEQDILLRVFFRQNETAYHKVKKSEVTLHEPA